MLSILAFSYDKVYVVNRDKNIYLKKVDRLVFNIGVTKYKLDLLNEKIDINYIHENREKKISDVKKLPEYREYRYEVKRLDRYYNMCSKLPDSIADDIQYKKLKDKISRTRGIYNRFVNIENQFIEGGYNRKAFTKDFEKEYRSFVNSYNELQSYSEHLKTQLVDLGFEKDDAVNEEASDD